MLPSLTLFFFLLPPSPPSFLWSVLDPLLSSERYFLVVSLHGSGSLLSRFLCARFPPSLPPSLPWHQFVLGAATFCTAQYYSLPVPSLTSLHWVLLRSHFLCARFRPSHCGPFLASWRDILTRSSQVGWPINENESGRRYILGSVESRHQTPCRIAGMVYNLSVEYMCVFPPPLSLSLSLSLSTSCGQTLVLCPL